MRNVRLIVGMVVLAGLMTPIVLAQDKAKDSTRGKRAQLPANYSKLGLTAEQKTKILDIRDKARVLGVRITDMFHLQRMQSSLGGVYAYGFNVLDAPSSMHLISSSSCIKQTCRL